MPMNTSGQMEIGSNSNTNNPSVIAYYYWYAIQNIGGTLAFNYQAVSMNHLGAFAGRGYYNAGGGHAFPTSNLAMSLFRGSSPRDEWNCACSACDCVGTG